jgi:hypothetical protein
VIVIKTWGFKALFFGNNKSGDEAWNCTWKGAILPSKYVRSTKFDWCLCFEKFPNWEMWPLSIPMPQAKRLLTKEYTQGCEGRKGWFLASVLPKTDAGGIEQRCIKRQCLFSWLRSVQKKPKPSLRYAGFTLLTFVQWDKRNRNEVSNKPTVAD